MYKGVFKGFLGFDFSDDCLKVLIKKLKKLNINDYINMENY